MPYMVILSPVAVYHFQKNLCFGINIIYKCIINTILIERFQHFVLQGKQLRYHQVNFKTLYAYWPIKFDYTKYL
jgi:hypothetical protein